MNLKKYLRRFVRKYIFGQMSSGQKDGGLSAAVMCSAVMCPAAKWVDTVQLFGVNQCSPPNYTLGQKHAVVV